MRWTNLRIGDPTATTGTTGAITLAAWTPGANFVGGGSLSINTTGAITQSGILTLSSATSLPDLILRNGPVTLTTSGNTIKNVAGLNLGTTSISSSAAALSIGSFARELILVRFQVWRVVGRLRYRLVVRSVK